MIKMIVGKKGTGKTKTIIAEANAAANAEHGTVVVLERGDKLRYDITHKARLIDTKEYDIADYERLIGFVSGLAAANYDITDIFMDSIYKIAKCEDAAALDQFVSALEKLNAHTNINFTITVSDDRLNMGSVTNQYIVEH